MKKLQVFVSSTYRDLLEERQAAVEAILKCGHIPAGMELFAAGNKSQLDTIYNWIDECDVYFLILGGRYGSVDPESGKSYTELEYDYARSKDKPYFSVVIKPEASDRRVKARGMEVVETENPKLLQSFRAKVLTSTSSFFDDTKDVKLTVHESLSAFARDHSLSGWVSGRELQDLDRLRKENVELRNSLSRPLDIPAGVSKSRSDERANEFALLEKILQSIELVVPREAGDSAREADEVMTLNSLLLMSADMLVRGVSSNSHGDYAQFLYGKVFPKLQVHGLADNEKPTGIHYRRSYLNKEGQRYLAWHARREIELKMDVGNP